MGRIILHMDFNSYFASVEQQANPRLRGQPIAVAGKGRDSLNASGANETLYHRQSLQSLQHRRSVVTTASKEAKRRGVKTAMSTFEAKKVCPELIIIPGDPFKYSEITKRFLKVLRQHADTVEQFSTDEAFADITVSSGGDYFGATILAQRIKNDVRKACGLACAVSIGIAPNKLVAKLASESMKPDGLTVIPPTEVSDFVLKQSLSAFAGIGFRIERHLEHIGATSVATLRNIPLSVLLAEFKSYGHFLFQAARGMGDDLVRDTSSDQQISYGHSYTFPYNLHEPTEIRRNLLALCDRVCWRMRRSQQVATHLQVYARSAEMQGCGGGKHLKEPVADGGELLENAWNILKDKLPFHEGVRLVGISVSGLWNLKGNRSLLPVYKKKERATEALDGLAERYGFGVCRRASTLGTTFHARTSGWHYDHD